MEIWNLLVKELDAYKINNSLICQYLVAYQAECQEIIERIASMDFENSQPDFDRLYAIQEKIATVKYKYGYPLDDLFQDFVYHLERDDTYSRQYWHERFRSGTQWPSE